MKYTSGFTFAFGVAILLVTCAPIISFAKYPSMPEINTKSNSTQQISKTYCLGRFLIDLPEGGINTGGNYKYNYAKIEPTASMNENQFTQEMQAHEGGLASIKHEKEPSLLRLTVKAASNTRIFAFWEESYSEYQVQIEGYKWVDGKQFHLKSEADPGKQSQAVNRMADRLTRIQYRADDEIPKMPGFCFKGGFIANDEWENEEAAMDFAIPDYPDVMISVTIFPLATRKHDKSLLERMGGILQSLGGLATGVHVLRKGERDFQGVQGQEYLATAPNEGGTRGHTFTWETQGDGTLDTPFVSIEMTSSRNDPKGNPRQTHLTDAEAIKLWDRVVGSFRLRPVDGSAKTSAAEPLKPLGFLAVTGRLCEQTGLWQCDTPSAVPSAARRFIQAGERMPHVLAYMKPTAWQKFKGEQPCANLPTCWELVSYEEPSTAPEVQADAKDDNASPSKEI